MKVSTKGRYGLRALVDLTVHSKESHVSLVSIAERQNISLNYLEQVFGSLRKAGLVKSIKGSQGGYVLARPARLIKIEDIITVLEGEYRIVDEATYDGSKNDSIQIAIKTLVWDKINSNVNELLSKTTLEDLALEYERLNGDSVGMYYI